MQRKPMWLMPVSMGLRAARGGPVAQAVVVRAEERAALDDLAWHPELRLGRVVAVRLAAGRRPPWSHTYQSVVHSHTLPAMSNKP